MKGDDWHNYFNKTFGADNVTWESASIQYHPEGGHHVEMPYYRVFSSGKNGIVRYYINGKRAK